MKKVLLILENNPNSTGGIERHCRNILEMFDGANSIQISVLHKEIIPYYSLKPINKIFFDTKALELAIKDCDIVHIHGFASLIVPQSIKIAHRLKKRIIYTAHYHPFYTLNNPLQGKFFFHFLLKRKLRYIDQIITINNEDTLFFRKYNSKVLMIPNWITGIPHIDARKIERLILFVGRNTPNKGIEYLNEIPENKYLINCVTDTENGLKSDIIVHKNIDDKQLSQLYSSASLLIAPSRYEAFSYVVLEALERGTPVLISDRVRIADHLSGIGGVNVFKYGEKKEFLKKIDLAINEKVEVEKIKKIFSPELIKEKLLYIYNQ
jgi:glycosyltransferase involved in cell wall biosynthesis